MGIQVGVRDYFITAQFARGSEQERLEMRRKIKAGRVRCEVAISKDTTPGLHELDRSQTYLLQCDHSTYTHIYTDVGDGPLRTIKSSIMR